MIKPINKLPERGDDREQLRIRSWMVEGAALDAEAALYGEFGAVWNQQAKSGANTRLVHGADRVIDRAFVEANLEAQSSRLASDQALVDAQQRVSEAFDEFPA